MHDYKTLLRRAGAVLFWLAVWQAAAMVIGQEVFLVSPIQAAGTLMELLPQAEFWQRIGFSAGRILLGFGLGVVCSAALAVAAILYGYWREAREQAAETEWMDYTDPADAPAEGGEAAAGEQTPADGTACLGFEASDPLRLHA